MKIQRKNFNRNALQQNNHWTRWISGIWCIWRFVCLLLTKTCWVCSKWLRNTKLHYIRDFSNVIYIPHLMQIANRLRLTLIRILNYIKCYNNSSKIHQDVKWIMYIHHCQWCWWLLKFEVRSRETHAFTEGFKITLLLSEYRDATKLKNLTFSMRIFHVQRVS